MLICEQLWRENGWGISFCYDEKGNIKKRFWINKPRNEKIYYRKFGYKAIYPNDRGAHLRLFERNLTKGEISKRYHNRKKRNLGFIPLNKPYKNSNAHHIDKDHVVYIPEGIHNAIYHSVLLDKNMDIINTIAFGFFPWKQCLPLPNARLTSLGQRGVSESD